MPKRHCRRRRVQRKKRRSQRGGLVPLLPSDYQMKKWADGFKKNKRLQRYAAKHQAGTLTRSPGDIADFGIGMFQSTIGKIPALRKISRMLS